MPDRFQGVKEPLEQPQKRREFRADGVDLIRGHGVPSQKLERTLLPAAGLSSAL
jgi:hypothetical protein